MCVGGGGGARSGLDYFTGVCSCLVRERSLTVASSPYVVYMLKDIDILEDIAAVRKVRSCVDWTTSSTHL